MAHTAFCTLALLPTMLLPAQRAAHRAALEKGLLPLLAAAACFALNIGLNNASLLSLPLSLNQVIR